MIKSSKKIRVSKSKSLDGSSKNNISYFIIKSFIRLILTFSPPDKFFIFLFMILYCVMKIECGLFSYIVFLITFHSKFMLVSDLTLEGPVGSRRELITIDT